MLDVGNARHGIARKFAAAAMVALIATLAACGGGGGGANATSGANEASSPSGASDTSGTSVPSTNASFFDGIFLKDSGSGFYQFDANFGSPGSKPVASGRTQFYVNADTDDNFTATTSAIAGNFTQKYVSQAYITSEGAFTSQTTPYTDMGTGSKIFQKLSQGYELGMRGMSAPLYRVTINAEDVSGLPVSQVVNEDKGPGTDGLFSLLSNDSTPMPQGSKIYQVPYSVLTTHLWVNLTTAMTSSGSLEQIQTANGGTIQSLGGYRYLQPTPNSAAFVEYNGDIYYGELSTAGDVNDIVPAAYNGTAADFIAQREAAALAQ